MPLSEIELLVSLTKHSCIFNNSMHLPCRHTFTLRHKLNEDLFDSTLYDNRWTAFYYRSTQRLFLTDSSQSSVSVVQSVPKRNRTISQHDKYQKAPSLASELASVTSNASRVHFGRRLKLLQDHIDHWKREEVTFIDVDEGKKNYVNFCVY